MRKNTEHVMQMSTFALSQRMDDFALHTRRLYIFGEISQETANYIIPTMQYLSLSAEPIYLYINSPGGDISSGYSIIDQMLLMQCKIVTIVIGHAYSMGAIIAAYGDPGNRFATKNSSLMIHDASSAPAPDYLSLVHESSKFDLNNIIIKQKELAKRMNITYNKLAELTKKSHWMNADEAIRIGLLDAIWDKKMESAVNSSYMSKIAMGMGE